ncbi:MAG: NaeI family type II restriction endonuclease, partial [Propionibacteriaceae bacterium]|nr:NaeI family type II restriction endonuclease [Propionibacteriaceae bacterium]
MTHSTLHDAQLVEIVDAIVAADPDGSRAARVFRETFDQLYDGEHTGRYSVTQLYKTEKTHFGTLIEINLRREFSDIICDGDKLDYQIAGHDIDCK